MLIFNAVVISVLVMLVLSIARVHVVISLFIASLVGGLVSGMGLSATMVAFQEGLAGGAKIALSYALLGAFAYYLTGSFAGGIALIVVAALGLWYLPFGTVGCLVVIGLTLWDLITR